MRSYFFNAEPTDDLVNHPTGYDREYDADDHAAFFAPLFSEAGVMAGDSADACKISVREGNTLQIAPGAAYVRGRMVLFDGTETITVSENCKVVARMDKSAGVRGFRLLAVRELVRTKDIFDLELASVELAPVPGGFEAKVTDARTFLHGMARPPHLFEPVTVEVPDAWEGGGPWRQVVQVPGVSPGDRHLEILPAPAENPAAQRRLYDAYACLSPAGCETVEGGVLLVCQDRRPRTGFQIIVRGVR